MRCAVYARISTDKQSADSPGDQIDRCVQFADARGWTVVQDLIAEESGISGSSRHNRPGLLELIARIDEWDVLLCWEFSRLARDSEDLGWIRNRLRLHKRIAYEAASAMDIFNVGAKIMGVLNEEFLVKLRLDTHRGLSGRVQRGFSGGGCPHGYKSVPVYESGRTDPRGVAVADGFRWEVDENQAETVRKIFTEYVNGLGIKAIAHMLNAQGAVPPRPRAQKHHKPSWSPSSIRSILLNPIYRGEYIWNRSEWAKDHETGRRKRYERPESEWIRQHDDAWRIVTEDLWQKAHEQFKHRRQAYKRNRQGRLLTNGKTGAVRGKHLLAGFLECAECGGNFYGINHHGRRYGCSWRRDRGNVVCSNDMSVPRGEIEERVVGALQDRVLTPENVSYAVHRALEIVERRLCTNADRGSLEARLAEIEREEENIVRLVAKLGHLGANEHVLNELAEERRKLAFSLAQADLKVDRAMLEVQIKDRLNHLDDALHDSPERGRSALRSLLRKRRLRVGKDPVRGFRIDGQLEFGVDLALVASPAVSQRATVVAGTGFEPATFGL